MAQHQCNFASKSNQRCAPSVTFTSLDSLEKATMKIPGKHMKISWLILSRIGVHYLSANFGNWMICVTHKKEFLDAWQVPGKCTHPDHISIGNDDLPTFLVNIVMSVKLLQRESKVVPISSKFCQKCYNSYNDKYMGQPGEKLYVVVPKPKPITSPFVPDPPTINSEDAENNAVVPMNIKSRGVLATSEPRGCAPEEITIKTELVIENDIGNNNKKTRSSGGSKNAVNIEEDEEEDVFSHDSDDDPTWAPKKNDGNNVPTTSKESSDMLQSFTPRKRKRIGPDEIGLKKTKAVTEEKANGSKKAKKTKKASTTSGSSDSDSDIMDVSEEKNRIEGAGGTDFHYYCKICQISFFKHTAFKHHVFSSLELHKQLKKKEKMKKEAEMEYECSDCCIAFQDRKSHQNHMIEEHSDTAENPFFCQKCNVYLKSESAFKSHNSKLHLERREKSYYCRECDETFSCLVKHSLHIVVHRTWTQEEMGMQCRICGKVFTRNQTLPFHRHLATHDTEPETECSCVDCTGTDPKVSEEEDKEPEQDPLDIRVVTRKRAKNKGNVLKKMQTLFNDDEDEEVIDSDDEAVKPYECGLCPGVKFSTAEGLGKHVAAEHSKKKSTAAKEAEKEVPKESPKERAKEITVDVIDEVTDEFANEVANIEAKSIKKSIKKAPRTNQERNWQECPDRNWAAEFGYGGGKTSFGLTKDILSKMAMSFKSASKDNEEEEEREEKKTPGYDSGVGIDDEDKIFRTRGFKGTVKASLNRAPRTLSTSSLRTRKRMEALMRRAREFMRKDKVKDKAKSSTKEATAPHDSERKEKEASKESSKEKENSPEKEIEKQRGRGKEEEAASIRKKVTVEEQPQDEEEDEEDLIEDDDDFDGISDGDDDDDTDGLLIPLENGWVCEKRLADPSNNSYSTHFWSPDGQRHSSLSAIKSYGNKKKLKLNMMIFERALKSNPHK